MKVAVVVGQFPALSETFVLDQVTGLLDRGVDVDVYAGTRRPQSTMHADVERYDLLERTTYEVPPVDRNGGHRARMLVTLARALTRSRGSAVPPLRIFRHGRDDARRALGFAERISSPRRYDVIHSHFGPQGLKAMAMRNMGLLRGKLVTTFHGYDMSRFLRDQGTDVYDRLFEEGDLFLPISRFWRAKLIEMGCDPSAIEVHHMGVRGDSFEFVRRELPDDGALRLLTVGRLVEKKGVEYAIRAAANLLTRYPEAEYTIIGSGPLRPSLDALVGKLGVADRVKLVGSRPRREVIAAMNHAHVLLAPSVTAADGNQEGIPVVIMEAMATGLPVVSTDHTGIPELVEDGVTGYLVAERDVESLSDVIVRLAGDSSTYSRMAAAARKRIEQEFEVTRLNDRLLRLFRRVATAP